MDNEARALLSEMARGAQLTFSNAKALYREGDLLRKHGSMNRALFLHQISLEECGKIEIIGGWATNLFIAGDLDILKMTKAFRCHKAKNYANAYFATPTAEELEARKRGNTKEAVQAFEQFQAKFHSESNSAKNASLYVNFTDSRFSAPSDVITEEMVIGIAALNAYFLELTAPYVRLLERMTNDEGELQRTVTWFCERVGEIKAQHPDDLPAVLDEVMQEVFEKYRGEAGHSDSSDSSSQQTGD